MRVNISDLDSEKDITIQDLYNLAVAYGATDYVIVSSEWGNSCAKEIDWDEKHKIIII